MRGGGGGGGGRRMGAGEGGWGARIGVGKRGEDSVHELHFTGFKQGPSQTFEQKT